MKHCDKCTKTFKNNHGLSVHKRRMHSPKGNWVSTPPRAGKVQRRRKAKPILPWKLSVPATTLEPGERRELPLAVENFFLWFLMRRQVNLKGLHTVSALCGAVMSEIRAMELEIETHETHR